MLIERGIILSLSLSLPLLIECSILFSMSTNNDLLHSFVRRRRPITTLPIEQRNTIDERQMKQRERKFNAQTVSIEIRMNRDS